MELTTTHLGLELKNPLIASASPLTASLDSIKKLEENGIAAVIIGLAVCVFIGFTMRKKSA